MVKVSITFHIGDVCHALTRRSDPNAARLHTTRSWTPRLSAKHGWCAHGQPAIRRIHERTNATTTILFSYATASSTLHGSTNAKPRLRIQSKTADDATQRFTSRISSWHDGSTVRCFAWRTASLSYAAATDVRWWLSADDAETAVFDAQSS